MNIEQQLHSTIKNYQW